MPDAITVDRAELRSLIREALCEVLAGYKAPRQDRRVMTVCEAARAYKVGARRIRQLWLAGVITGREIPGRGRTGKTLRLSIPSLEAALAGNFT